MVSTLKIYEILEAANVEPRTARAIAHSMEQAFTENNLEQSKVLATKEDIAQLRLEMTKEFAQVRVEFAKELANVKSELLRWMFIFWIGLIPIIAGLIKFIR